MTSLYPISVIQDFVRKKEKKDKVCQHEKVHEIAKNDLK